MGRLSWLFVGILVLLFLTCVRFHHLPGTWGESWSIEFVPPWK
jgi:hypothetical protein